MKKLVLILSCLMPMFAFAAVNSGVSSIDLFQEQCAKEKDPVKRQSSCHMLDRHSETQAIPEIHKETATV